MIVQTGVSASRARQSAGHRVFVEGSGNEAIDPVVIGALLRANDLPQVDALPMGACENVRSAAEALIREHPSYYFIIDRDDQDHETVELSWTNFQNLSTHNLIIWRKRELENYFIDPEYLSASEYLHCDLDELMGRIREESQRRLYLDAANLVIRAAHRSVRRPFAVHFSDPNQFATRNDGLDRLLAMPEMHSKQNEVSVALSMATLESQYKAFVDELSGGNANLEYGTGTWLERLSGKEIFRSIAGPCFRVITNSGEHLQGKDQHNEIARDLVKKDVGIQPSDFRELIELIRTRVAEP